MTTTITAFTSSAIPEGGLPGEIVYLPVGRHSIAPSVNGRPKAITINVPAERGAEIAASLQAALDKRLAGPVRPRLAFDHSSGGPAAGLPKAFRWDPARASSWRWTGQRAAANRSRAAIILISPPPF